MKKKGRKKKDYRQFEQVLRGIRSAEKDVDKLLKAARLQRQERPSFWEGTDFSEIIFGAVIVLGMLGMFTFMILTILLT